MASLCPFAKRLDLRQSNKPPERQKADTNKLYNKDVKGRSECSEEAKASPKCPFGYDAGSFKLGPFSCVICRALLYESSKCVPCGHKYCKACISRFKDCPLCGADIDNVEGDPDLQRLVDQFIEGHGRIKRVVPCSDNAEAKEEKDQSKMVTYEDVSLERGSFLLQQAMRAFQAQNLESAKSRLTLCAEDICEQMEKSGSTTELCSQLGAVLGMLGDCCRAMGDVDLAVKHYNDSVEFLSKLSLEDSEVVHALSVSLNKIGDLKYYAGDLSCARGFYSQSLDVRKKALKDHTKLTSQLIDVAVSLAKVADVDRGMGNENAAIDGFQEAIKSLEGLSLQHNEALALQNRHLSVLEFLHGQVKQPPNADSTTKK
eukprot:TRINITY_DN800_c0_g1_i1.p1 TRINITY_DN800_c0_g1~~TRINITY_DN800_c0_g1_i1.p1  ORF type:complete len:372 (+),score=75.48 TRINITY_DN800_c0_g1_i1:186-1301(+)